MAPEKLSELITAHRKIIHKIAGLSVLSKVNRETFVTFDLEGSGRVHIPPDQIERLWNQDQQLHICGVCGERTHLACSDCQIDLHTTVYVCSKTGCRDKHERKCPAKLLEILRAVELQVELCASAACHEDGHKDCPGGRLRAVLG